jgi:non-specific serine/threonine protein kinase
LPQRIGPYEIIATLGSGGMGDVFRARDARLQRDVALKVLPAGAAHDPAHVERFRREARAVAALSHPNIVTIHSVEEFDGTHFLTMELVDGRSLADDVVPGGCPLARLLAIGVPLADALAAAHERGIVHRDLKPANVMVDRQGRVKVLDFGLAKTAAADPETADETRLPLTGAGVVVGTIPYMSPEQIEGRAVDARTDIFALGVVLYELATGARPFSAASSAGVMTAILRDDPAPLAERRPDLPAPFARVVSRCLAKNPNDRIQTARDVCNELRALLSDARPAPPAVADRPSIVVLPFENRSADPDNEYFSDGLTDEIITDLSQVRTLRVISRTSSLQLKGATDLRSVAATLGVRYVLTGSVRKSGAAVRITAALVDPVTNEQLWADKHSGTLEDIFDIQEQISRRIVDALKMSLSPSEDRRLAERPLDNVRALECYQRAWRELYKFTREGLDEALALIETALGLVGDNELLYAAKGAVHWQYVNAAIRADAQDIEQAEACAARVFALNRESAAGHGLLGLVRQAQGRPLEAVASFRRAIAIDPANVYAFSEIGRVLGTMGRDRESTAMMRQALYYDPLSPIQQHGVLWNALISGDIDLVLRDAPRILRSVPEFAMVRWDLAVSLIQVERRDEAQAVLATAPAEKVATIAGRLCVFLELALAGRRDEALTCVGDHLLTCARNVEYWSWLLAECYGVLGEQERTLDWLENAVQRGFVHYPYLSRSRTFDSLRANPRFADLLDRVHTVWQEMQTRA